MNRQGREVHFVFGRLSLSLSLVADSSAGGG